MVDLLRAGFRSEIRDWFAVIVAAVCGSLLGTATPLLLRIAVNSALARSDKVELWRAALALGGSALAIAVLDLARSLALLRLRSKMAISKQAALWDRLLALPVSFFRRFTPGDLTNRSMGIDQAEQLLTADVTAATFAIFAAVSNLAILFCYSVRLACIALAGAAILAIFTYALGRRQLIRLRVLQEIDGRLSSFVYTVIVGIAKLRVAGAEKRAFSKWFEGFSEQRRHGIAVRRLSNAQSLMAVSLGAGMWVTMMALSHAWRVSPGDYVAFNVAFSQFQATAIAGITMLPSLLAIVPICERLQPLLNSVPESKAHGSIRDRSAQVDDGAVELCNVSFRYPDGPLVLDHVSLRAAPGQFIALVGVSGSGKSTCLRLMLGFDSPETGSVRIDGRDIRLLDMQMLRRQFGVVRQSGRPLVGSIFHNITGNYPLSAEEAWSAARFVGLEKEIKSMPMGLFTAVNQRGICFSGGQRQRLLLARAIVRRPRILLLDEATSSLDNPTQELIMRNLETLGATRVVVAHRLSTVRHADCIYVFNHGRVVEQGRFDALMERDGIFARMAERQMV
jgi:ATP-binding cassette subfamily C protein